MSQNIKIELLAPAGNLEKAVNAFAFGADAVYLGVPDLSLRARINDFDDQKIREAVAKAHDQNKKVYVTINIFAHNKHIDKLPKHIKHLEKIGVDAIIASDPGVIAMIREIWPKCEIHLSTQANCTNWKSAEFWQRQGVKRIILGRETTLKEIKEIHKKCPKLELEVFVHGAMCMAYSGRCFLSKYFLDRSGNLGDCVQPCRWNYFISEEKRPEDPLQLVEDKKGSYILSSKDLCLIEYLDELKKAGVSSFKIEGRTKSVYYQATVVNAYRQAIDKLQIAKSRLQKTEYKKFVKKLFDELNTRLVHRGYFTGFLFGGQGDQELKRSRTSPAWEFCGQVISNKKISNIKYQTTIKVHNTLKTKETIEVVRPFLPVLKTKIKKMLDTKTKKPLEEAHGGSGGKSVIIETEQDWPLFSVLRRKTR